MIGFIIGMFVGGFIGVAVMCVLCLSPDILIITNREQQIGNSRFKWFIKSMERLFLLIHIY